MKNYKGFWFALIGFMVAVVAIQIQMNAANTNTTHTYVVQGVRDSASSPALGYPFTHAQYANDLTGTSGIVGVLSHDIVDVSCCARGYGELFAVLTVSEDAGSAKGFGSCVLFARSSDSGSTWTDVVTLDPVIVPAGSAAATADAVSYDVCRDAKIVCCGDNVFVSFLSSAMIIGNTNDNGAPGNSVDYSVNGAGTGNKPNFATLDATRGQTARRHATHPANGLTVSDPNFPGETFDLSFSLRPYIIASTDDGASWTVPQMIPTQYGRYTIRTGAFDAGEFGAVNTGVLSFDGAIPGSSQLACAGDGTSVDRVYFSWLDIASYDASQTGIINGPGTGGDMPKHALRPYFAVLTFDNVTADAGYQGMHYLASGPAFVTTSAVVGNGGYMFGNSGDGYNSAVANLTFDKLQLHVLGSSHGWTGGSDGNVAVTGSISTDKVWLLAHHEGTSADNNETVRVATLDTVASWLTRTGGANTAVFPKWGSHSVVDHTGIRLDPTTNTGSAEEFDFDAAIDGEYTNASLYVFLTSNINNHVARNGVSAGGGAGGTTTGLAQANSMYLVNVRDPSGSPYDGTLPATIARVSLDMAHTFESGAVTYSNVKVCALGNGEDVSTGSPGTVSDDYIVMAFEAAGVTRDDVAGWTDTNWKTAGNTHNYITVDNVYVIAHLRSAYTAGADDYAGFNFSRASRVDGYTEGQIYDDNTSSNTSATITRDSVSSDSVLLDLKCLKVIDNDTSDQYYYICPVFLDNTDGGAKGTSTSARVRGSGFGTAAANTSKYRWYDLFKNYQLLMKNSSTDGREGQYSFTNGLRISSEQAASADSVDLFNTAPTSFDICCDVKSTRVLNETRICFRSIYLRNIDIVNGTDGETLRVAGNSSASGGASYDNSANNEYDAFFKECCITAFFDALRSSSSGGLCIIGVEDEANAYRR